MVRPPRNDRAGIAPRRPAAARARLGGLALIVTLLAACGTSTPRPVKPEFDLRHPSATRRVEAVTATVSARDTAQVPALILLLEDDDDAVRLAAGAALRDLTGHDTGYKAFAPPEERGRQAAAWRAWWAERSGAPAAPVPATGRTPGPVPGPTGGARHDGPP